MNAPAKPKPDIFQILKSDNAINDIAELSMRGVDARRFAQITISALHQKWSDLKTCDPFTIFTAVREAAQLDLDTSIAANEFYFVPFKGACVGMLGYRGMIRLAYRIGAVEKLDARLVFAGDQFEFEETQNGPTWRHVPYWQAGNDRGGIRFSYAHAKLRNGEIVFKVADQQRIQAAKNASKAKGTWEAHPEAMTTKTAVRELWKWLPKDGIDRKVSFAVDDDAMRDDTGMTPPRVQGGEWIRGVLGSPPDSVAELQPAPGLAEDAPTE